MTHNPATLFDLERYPLDQPHSTAWTELLEHCRQALDTQGMFTLEGLVHPAACEQAVAGINPVMQTESFEHRRRHNVYFQEDVPGLPADHPALRKLETVNHTLCADQLQGQIIETLYTYTPLVRFLAAALRKPDLYLMEDPLARVNVMAYRAGEALNWHFDRSEFTTTLLLQSPESGGVFEYRNALRSDRDPNYPGVATVINQEDPATRELALEPGALQEQVGPHGGGVQAHRVDDHVAREDLRRLENGGEVGQ